jgi:dCMP deaminase
MSKRPNKHLNYLLQASVIADRSTCLRRHIGSILVDLNGHQIASGYNGAPTDQDHCSTCLREKLHIKPGMHYEACKSVHSEANALIQAGREARGSTLYLVSKDAKTGNVIFQTPCYMCSKLLLNAGVGAIVMLLPHVNGAVDWVVSTPREVYRERDREMWDVWRGRCDCE